jgi:integrase
LAFTNNIKSLFHARFFTLTLEVSKKNKDSKDNFGIKADIHDMEQRIQLKLRQIEKVFSPKDKSLIAKYIDAMVLDSVSNSVIDKHLWCILTLSKTLNKDWQDITKSDVQRLVVEVMKHYSKTGQETHTTLDFKKVLKIFIRWMKTGERRKSPEISDPEESRWIRMKKVSDKLARENLITKEETEKMILACAGNLRDKALIAVHYDAGDRVGETLTLQIKHIIFDENGARIKVSGKTGSRGIRLLESVPHLRAWINAHPFKDNPEAPLWINQSQYKFGQQLTYRHAHRKLKQIAELAGIKKRVYFHLFRHSRVTETAKFMPEPLQKVRYGWTSDSKMTSRYSHLGESDVDDALLEHYGLKKEKTKPKQAQKCTFCHAINAASATNCEECDRPLSLIVAMDDDRKIDSLREEFQKQMDVLTHKIDLVLRTNPSQQFLGSVPN